jgi:hypothetical protein
MFVFDLASWPPENGIPEAPPPSIEFAAGVMLRRAAVLNARLVCLYTAISRRQNYCHNKMVVSPDNLITFESFDKGGFGSIDPRTTWLALSRFPTTYAAGLPIDFDPRLFTRMFVIELATLDESFELLDGVLRHPDSDPLFLADLHLRSCKAFEEHYYSLSLVTAWTIVEKLLRLLWARYLDENRDRPTGVDARVFINADRKARLTEGRDYSAAVISKVLSLADRIDFSLYSGISEVRKARNDWIHGLKPAPREATVKAITVAEQMFSKVCGLDIKVPVAPKLAW